MIWLVFIISIFLVILVYTIFFMIFYKKMVDYENLSSYECGFDPMSLTRLTFSYRFFLISILFLIFDVEISLMLPIPYLVAGIESLWLFLGFIFVLIAGLLYEYYCGSLEWLSNFMSKA